jgi:hypothetical protein
MVDIFLSDIELTTVKKGILSELKMFIRYVELIAIIKN